MGGNGEIPHCVPLVIKDPTLSLDGYTLYRPQQKQNDPFADSLKNVSLRASSKDGVVIDGPDVALSSLPAGALTLEQPAIALVGKRTTSADGYLVTANSHLHYTVDIRDFEYEMSLAEVDLCQDHDVLKSSFIFLAGSIRSGIASDITIKATADGTTFGPAPLWTVEVSASN